MTRLINHMRASIMNRMLENAFAVRVVALMDTQAVIADQIYNDVYPASKRDILNGSPEGYFPMVESIKISIVGMTDHTKGFQFNGALQSSMYSNTSSTEYDCYQVLTREQRERGTIKRRVAYKHQSAIVKNFDPSASLAKSIVKWIDNQRALSAEIVEARKLATATMDAFTTVEKLIEGWPEIEPFTRHYQPPAPVQLPAIPIAKLNGLLGLPVSE